MTDDAPKAEREGTAKPEPPRRPSVARRVLRGLRNVVGVTVLLLVIVVAWLHTDSGAETLKPRLEKRLSERVTTKVTIGKLKLSLVSGITLEDVGVFDRDGQAAIVAGRIFVKPRLWESHGGTIALDEVVVERVILDVRGQPDGTTNLTGLAKPSPPREPSDSNAKSDRHIQIHKLGVREVAVHVTKPDGAKIDVEGGTLEGEVDTRPSAGTTSAGLALTVAKVTVDRPRELTLTVTEISTKATAALVGGRGPIAIGPTRAAIRLARPEQKEVTTKLALPSLTAEVAPERLTLALETLELAALSIATAKVEAARKADGAIDRVESARVTRLSVKAADVEALAGKRVLASDLTIELAASGPAEAFVVDTKIATGGGDIAVRAALDLRTAGEIRYDASLTTKALDVKKVYASEKVPPLVLGEVALSAKGSRKEGAPPALTGTLLLRDVHVRDVTVDAVDARFRVANHVVDLEELTVRALGQKMDAKGTYGTESKEINAEISADARVSELLARLQRAGLLSRPPSPIVSALALSRPAKIHVTGKVDGEMTLEVDEVDATIAGGSARARVTARVMRGDPTKDEKAIVVKHVDADVDLQSVSLAEIGRLRGKALPVAGRARGRLHVEGELASPTGELDLTVDLTRPEDPAQRVGTLRARGNLGAGDGRIDARLALTSESGTTLATVDVKGSRAGLAAPLAVTVDVPERSLAELAPFLAPELREKLPGDARVALTAKIDGGARRTTVAADLQAHSPNAAPITLRARAVLEGPPSTAKTAPLSWTLDLDVPESEIPSLPLPPERRAALAEVRGKVALALHAKGTRDDATGDLTLTTRGVTKGDGPPLDARVAVALTEDATTLSLEGTLSELRVLEGSVRAALGGKGLVAAVRSGTVSAADPALTGTITIPERTMMEWSRLAAGAGALPGKLGGELRVAGVARDPELHLRLGYAGYRTLAGSAGSVAIDAQGKREDAVVTVKANDAMTLTARVSPAEIFEARKVDGGTAKIHASLDADRVPIASLLPDTEDLRASRPEGWVDARMTADASLVFHTDARELGALALAGPLTVSEGAFQIPTTWRRVHDVALRLEGDGDKLAIRQIAAKESDRDEPNRSLTIDGAYAVRERALSLHAKAHRVLVSGGTFGTLDAPKAALSADLSVQASLAGAVRRVVVDVDALDLDSGDRQPRAVQQEVLSLGDVIEVSPGAPIGKLPVALLPLSSPGATKPARPMDRLAKDKTLDVLVRIPKPIHIKQRPLELRATGEVHIERYADERVLSGKLTASDGSLLVGGRMHPLTRGEVRMTEEGPFLDLHFRREPHPAALRDVATANGTDVYAHMVGPFGKQKISFSGVADGLFEGLAIENIGRVRVLSTPDAPAGQTPQLPLVPQIRQTAFMSANLPHLAFLDRMNTYADPNVSRFAYGRFENLEAERYSKDGTLRVRTTVRSRVIGQSDAEVEGSLLFRNDARVITGVGLLGGTRVGGGPTIFLEWSSAE